MMNITNYKLKDFVQQKPELIAEYMAALKFMKPRSTDEEIFHMKLKDVETIKQGINSGNDIDLIEIVGLVQYKKQGFLDKILRRKKEKMKPSEVVELPIIEFFGIVNSIKKQLEVIMNAEQNSLVPSEINLKWEAVNGSERMAKFGIYNTLESLSGGDALEFEQYMNMSYSEVFTILLMRKTAAELKSEMDKIKLD